MSLRPRLPPRPASSARGRAPRPVFSAGLPPKCPETPQIPVCPSPRPLLSTRAERLSRHRTWPPRGRPAPRPDAQPQTHTSHGCQRLLPESVRPRRRGWWWKPPRPPQQPVCPPPRHLRAAGCLAGGGGLPAPWAALPSPHLTQLLVRAGKHVVLFCHPQPLSGKLQLLALGSPYPISMPSWPTLTSCSHPPATTDTRLFPSTPSFLPPGLCTPSPPNLPSLTCPAQPAPSHL